MSPSNVTVLESSGGGGARGGPPRPFAASKASTAGSCVRCFRQATFYVYKAVSRYFIIVKTKVRGGLSNKSCVRVETRVHDLTTTLFTLTAQLRVKVVGPAVLLRPRASGPSASGLRTSWRTAASSAPASRRARRTVRTARARARPRRRSMSLTLAGGGARDPPCTPAQG